MTEGLSQQLPQMSLAVVGVRHLNANGSNRQFAILECEPGENVELRLEPDNPADNLAVAVWSKRGVQLGYLTAERAPRIGGIIRQGREVIAIFQNVAEHGAWIRAAFDGETPALPSTPARNEGVDEEPREEPDQDWYPDPIWPDD